MPKKILVIEDDPSILAGVLDILGLEGYDVRGQNNGANGIQEARQFLPDLIISDIAMPGIDGLQVLEELRKDPATAAIPFILLTGRTGQSDMRQGMELGADDYLTKPVAVTDLINAIRTGLERPRMIVGAAERKLED
jgi:DNA-binding response OmpR family regulator